MFGIGIILGGRGDDSCRNRVRWTTLQVEEGWGVGGGRGELWSEKCLSGLIAATIDGCFNRALVAALVRLWFVVIW